MIETCKVNAIEPHAWQASTFTAIFKSHKSNQIEDLRPWNTHVE